MDIPDFSEFIASINIEEFKEIIAESTPQHLFQFDPTDTQSVLKAAELLQLEAARTSARISLFYLETYHAWLQEVL